MAAGLFEAATSMARVRKAWGNASLVLNSVKRFGFTQV